MIRAIRPNAMAQDDAAMISGWNVAPNIAHTLVIIPGSASCGVLLYDDDGSTLIASGAALAGTDQPCVLIPQTGQTVGMVDADLGWHLLLTTTGTESQRTIRLGPAVDLPDEIHPVYGDDELALARATAAIDAAAHYIDDVTVTCPLGLGAGLGDVVSVPVDGVAIVGQVESITWTATPDGAIEQAVIRRHVAIAPAPAVAPPVPPTVADDTGSATTRAGTAGNVLTNDGAGLSIVAVNGLSALVGVAVAGDNGGVFTINAGGSWTFDPNGDFSLLGDGESAYTRITYYASDGTSEAMARLTVTVTFENTAPVAVNDVGATFANATTAGNVLANDSDIDGNDLFVSKVAGSDGNVGQSVMGSNGGQFVIASSGAWTFDPDGDFSALTEGQTATTSIAYHVSDGEEEDSATLTVTVSFASAPLTLGDLQGCGAWYDMSVPSWTFVAGTEKISTLSDLSGNGNTLSRIVNYELTLAYINGLPILFNDSGRKLQQSVWSGIDDSYGIGIVQLFWVSSATTYVSPPLGIDILSNKFTRWTSTYERFNYNGINNDVAGTAIKTKTSPFIHSIWIEKNGVSSGVHRVLERFHGVVFRDIGITATWTTAAGAIRLMAYDTNRRLNGYFAEGAVLTGPINIGKIEQAEGILAHKWDARFGTTTIVGALPSGHAYKSSPPMS